MKMRRENDLGSCRWLCRLLPFVVIVGLFGFGRNLPSLAAAPSATITVCHPGCDHTTIQAAVDAANSGDTIQLIQVFAGVAHTEASIYIDKNVTIAGSNQYQTIVQAAAAPISGDGNVFTIASDRTVAMRDFIIQNGSPAFGLGSGGAISMLSASNVTLERMTIRHNHATSGGGINNDDGTLTLSQVSIYGNTATGAFGGIGIGGGIASSGTTYLTNVTISDNRSNRGGGIFQCGGQLSMANVTVTANTAMDNSVPGNDHDGGGVYIAECANTSANLRSSIIAGNSVESGGVYPDCFGTFTGGFSLIENRGPFLGTLCGMSGLTSGMIYDTSPQFGAASGAGFAYSYPLLSGSPAIDAGSCAAAIGAAPTTDQRGYAMPVDGDGSGSAECDMGAYEYNSVPTSIHLTQNSAKQSANPSLSLLALLLVVTAIAAKRAGRP